MTLILEHDFNDREPDGTYSVWLRDADESPGLGDEVWLLSENEGMLRGRVLRVAGEFARVEPDYSTWIDTSVSETTPLSVPSASAQARFWIDLSEIAHGAVAEHLVPAPDEWLPYDVTTSGWVTVATSSLTFSTADTEDDGDRLEVDLVRWAAAHRNAA
jgi:hypothetical protein